MTKRLRGWMTQHRRGVMTSLLNLQPIQRVATQRLTIDFQLEAASGPATLLVMGRGLNQGLGSEMRINSPPTSRAIRQSSEVKMRR